MVGITFHMNVIKPDCNISQVRMSPSQSLLKGTYNVSTQGRKEGNVLFNDTLNTFYLRLYGVGHMVKDHSDRREKTCYRHIGYSFRLAARVLLYASSHRQDNTYHSLCYTSRGALAGTRNSSMVSNQVTNKCKFVFLGLEHNQVSNRQSVALWYSM